MTLDPTARTANIKDSLKKFLVDSVYRTSNIPVTFDKALSSPKLQGNKSVDRWISVKLEDLDLGTLSSQPVSIYCCTRKDREGFRLAQTVDTVLGNLSDTDQTDGLKRITFYRSYENQAWVVIGAFLVTNVEVGGEQEAVDDTKFRIVTFNLRFASKV